MNNLRLYFRVALKLLTFIALAGLSAVFINSLFVGSNSNINHSENIPVVLDISSMKKGEIRKTRWKGKEVAVLFKGNSSLKKQYFVYENYGDSGNCPLFYTRDTFKDICTGQLFDLFGRQKNNPEQGYRLIIPPHYIQDKKIVFGVKHK